jgi:peroxiredoxin
LRRKPYVSKLRYRLLPIQVEGLELAKEQVHGMRSMEHLVGMSLPPLRLPSTTGQEVRLTQLSSERAVLYLYPGDEASEQRAAQPSSCAVQRATFREYALDFAAQGAKITGVSSEPPHAQIATAKREHLPFALASDSDCALAEALELPTYLDLGVRRYRRLTLICDEGAIAAVFYPVSPRRSAPQALSWLQRVGPTSGTA